jgi:hypothetical protein
LEYWNDGIVGFGKMEKWGIDKIHCDSEVKNIQNELNFFKNQYSNIPLFDV